MPADREFRVQIAALSGTAAGEKTSLGEPSHLAKLVAWLAERRPLTIALACGYVAVDTGLLEAHVPRT